MNTDEVEALLGGKSWRAEFTITDHSLRIFLQDLDSGDCGLLAVEPVQLALPDERAFEYSWQDIALELGPPPEECLILDLKTRVGPDYERHEVPFLFD